MKGQIIVYKYRFKINLLGKTRHLRFSTIVKRLLKVWFKVQ